MRPRPHGRGGFKGFFPAPLLRRPVVPAHTGGVDLREKRNARNNRIGVPAHTGGVDLRRKFDSIEQSFAESPPTRAGWI